MGLNEKNKELIYKHILKYRTDLTSAMLDTWSNADISMENKNISKFENFQLGSYGIPKGEDFNNYINKHKGPNIISFTDWRSHTRRLTYMEYLYCLNNNMHHLKDKEIKNMKCKECRLYVDGKCKVDNQPHTPNELHNQDTAGIGEFMENNTRFEICSELSQYSKQTAISGGIK